jgi:hypothetical protein
MSSAGNLADVVEHEPVRAAEVSSCVIPPQLDGEFLVQAGPAEKLQVAFQSVKALVLHRDDRGDHLLLTTG